MKVLFSFTISITFFEKKSSKRLEKTKKKCIFLSYFDKRVDSYAELKIPHLSRPIIVKDKKSGEVTMRYANTDYHKGMVFGNEACIGGGMFTFDDDKNEMLLWGRSDDFGAPKFSEIKDKIHADEDLQGMTIILGNIIPTIEAHREDITDKFLFDN